MATITNLTALEAASCGFTHKITVKAADIGVAMGGRGTDVAREAVAKALPTRQR